MAMSKAERDARAQEGENFKKKYWDYKRAALNLENNNQQYIILFRSTSLDQKKKGQEWWKMGWNSVLLYVHVVAKRIRKSPVVHPDLDGQMRSDAGVVSISGKHIEEIEKSLKELKILRNKKLSDENLLVFDLGYKVSKEDLKRYKRADETMRSQLNDLVPVSMAFGDVDAKLTELVKESRNLVRKMPASDREIYGAKLGNETMRAMDIYRQMTWTTGANVGEWLGKVAMELFRIISTVNTLEKAGVISVYQAKKLGVLAAETYRLVRVHMGDKKLTAGEVLEKRTWMKGKFGSLAS